MNCIACGCSSEHSFTKGEIPYFRCPSCNSYFVPFGLEQEDKVGGGMEFQRNAQQNSQRLSRILTLAGDKPAILDFGCGHGLFVSALIMVGHNAVGYDKFNPTFNVFPQGDNQFDICTMVEVIEHLTHPWQEISDIHRILKTGGVLYIESSFSDLMGSTPEDVKNTVYVEPTVGHCSILSHKGLNQICIDRGFLVGDPIDGNTRIFRKKG